MGTSNPGLILSMDSSRRIIGMAELEDLVNASVSAAVGAALAAKADLIDGVIPDEQLPDRLADAQIAITAGNAAAAALTDALEARNLPAPLHLSSVALGADTTAEGQVAVGARHWEILPSTAPLAPVSGARTWVETIAGKNTLRIQFPTGLPITLATEL